MGEAEAFVGRINLIAEIRRRAGERRRTVVVGEPGIGKTALIRRLADTLSPVAVHYCSGRESSSISPIVFAESISAQLCRSLPGFTEALLKGARGSPSIEIHQIVTASPGAQITGIQVERLLVGGPSPYQAFDQLVGAPLRALKLGDTNLVILVDALDEARQLGQRPNILDLIANSDDLPEAVRWIVTSRPADDLADLDGAPITIESIGGENAADLAAYVRARLSALGLPAPQVESLGAALAIRAEGNFLYATLVLTGLKGRSEGVSVESFVAAAPAGLDQYYAHALRALVAAHPTAFWREIARPMLGVLAAAFEPLSSTDLSLAAGLSRQAVLDTLGDLQEFLEPLSDSSASQLFHQTLVEFLGEEGRAGRFWIDIPATHGDIATRLKAAGAVGWAEAPAYATRHVADHMAAASRADELRSLLLTYDWMHAKLLADRAQGLIEAYNSSRDRTSRLVQSALRLSAHIVAHEPDRLAEQLVARLAPDDPDVAGFVTDVRRQHRLPWLRPIRRSLASPSGAERLTLLPSCGAVAALAISADERWSAIGGESGAVEVWDIDSGVPVSSFVVSDQRIAHVALSPKGANVAATDTDGRLVLWSVALQRERLRREPKSRRSSRTRNGPRGGFQALAFTDNETVVAFDPTGVVLRWRDGLATDQVEQIKLRKFKPGYVADAKIAPTAGILVATGHDATLRSWSLRTGTQQIEIGRVSDGLWNNAVAVDAGGVIAITTSHDRLHVWRLEDAGELATKYIGHFRAGAMEVGASTGRLYLGGFTGGGGGGSRARSRIEVYDTSTLRRLKSLVGNVGGVRQLAVGAAEHTAVSSGGESSVKVWRLDAVKDRSLRRDHEDDDEADDDGEERDDAQLGAHLNSITFSKDGVFALCGVDANAVVFFDVEKATPLRSVSIDDEMWYRGPSIGVLEAGLSPDGRHMVAGSGSGKMRIARVREDILDPAKPEYSPGLSLEGHFDGQFHHVTKVKFLPSGDAVTGDADGNICVWRLQDGERLRKIKVGDGEVIGLTVDGRNETLVSATEYGGVRWWSLDDLSPVAALNVEGVLTGLAAFPRSDGVIIGYDDGTLLYAHPGIAAPQSVKVGAGSVSAVAVQTASGLCIWGCVSGEIGIATVIEGRLTMTALRQSGDGCTCISPADDKAAFVAGTAGGELTLWDLGARKAVASFRADSGITACGMAPRSGIIVAGDRNGRVHWLALEGATLASFGALAV